MQNFKGAHYFFAQNPADPAAPKEKGNKPLEAFLIVSKDKGATWAKQGTPTDGAWGPHFGKDERHVVTLGKMGMIVESTDGGETWKDVVKVPAKGYATNVPGWFTNLGYDPKGDVFYVSRMGQGTLKYERK
jgi:photosystem II stability/assembly factor-like uncharacterized protein